MPTYEYKCPDGHLSSEVRGMNDDAIISKCPECDKPLSRIFKAPPITFKGSGFSQTNG